MTTKPASAQYIGKQATYNTGQLQFTVTIKDHRHNWGRDDVLIVPVSGSGEKWVSLESVKVEA